MMIGLSPQYQLTVNGLLWVVLTFGISLGKDFSKCDHIFSSYFVISHASLILLVITLTSELVKYHLKQPHSKHFLSLIYWSTNKKLSIQYHTNAGMHANRAQKWSLYDDMGTTDCFGIKQTINWFFKCYNLPIK